jgi:peptide/nickel transport system permease protein
MGALLVLVVIVAACVAAPLYARYVAHTNPFQFNVSGTTVSDGKTVPVLQQSTTGLRLGVTPIGPTWSLSHYFLGADNDGRDVFARLLYGGRTSLVIGAGSAVLCCLLATIIALIAGYFGGIVDGVLSRLMDFVWAFPVYLLAISLSVVLLASGGLNVGPLHLASNSLWVPTLIIAGCYLPYVARPIRGQVLSLRRSEFVEAAVGVGASDVRIIFRDLVPNILPTVIVFAPLMMAINMLTESALSFLSIGVRPPNASWGTIINDGIGLLYTRPAVTIAPGLALAVVAVALNVLGDGVREAFDPRGRRFGRV